MKHKNPDAEYEPEVEAERIQKKEDDLVAEYEMDSAGMPDLRDILGYSREGREAMKQRARYFLARTYPGRNFEDDPWAVGDLTDFGIQESVRAYYSRRPKRKPRRGKCATSVQRIREFGRKLRHSAIRA